MFNFWVYLMIYFLNYFFLIFKYFFYSNLTLFKSPIWMGNSCFNGAEIQKIDSLFLFEIPHTYIHIYTRTYKCAYVTNAYCKVMKMSNVILSYRFTSLITIVRNIALRLPLYGSTNIIVLDHCHIRHSIIGQFHTYQQIIYYPPC